MFILSLSLSEGGGKKDKKKSKRGPKGPAKKVAADPSKMKVVVSFTSRGKKHVTHILGLEHFPMKVGGGVFPARGCIARWPHAQAACGAVPSSRLRMHPGTRSPGSWPRSPPTPPLSSAAGRLSSRPFEAHCSFEPIPLSPALSPPWPRWHLKSDMKLKDASKALGKRLAGSVAIKDTPTGDKELQAQGDWRYEIADILEEVLGVPAAKITVKAE